MTVPITTEINQKIEKRLIDPMRRFEPGIISPGYTLKATPTNTTPLYRSEKQDTNIQFLTKP